MSEVLALRAMASLSASAALVAGCWVVHSPWLELHLSRACVETGDFEGNGASLVKLWGACLHALALLLLVQADVSWISTRHLWSKAKRKSDFEQKAIGLAEESGRSLSTTAQVCHICQNVVRVTALFVAAAFPPCSRVFVLCGPAFHVAFFTFAVALSCLDRKSPTVSPQAAVCGLLLASGFAATALSHYFILYFAVLGTVQSLFHGLMDHSSVFLLIVQHVESAWDPMFFRDFDSILFGITSFAQCLVKQKVHLVKLSAFMATCFILIAFQVGFSRSITCKSDALCAASFGLSAAERGAKSMLDFLENGTVPFNASQAPDVVSLSSSDLVKGGIGELSLQFESIIGGREWLTAHQMSRCCTAKAIVLFSRQKYEHALACFGCISLDESTSSKREGFYQACVASEIIDVDFESSISLFPPTKSTSETKEAPANDSQSLLKDALESARDQVAQSVDAEILESGKIVDAVSAVKTAKENTQMYYQWAISTRNLCHSILKEGSGSSSETMHAENALSKTKIVALAHALLEQLGFTKLALWCQVDDGKVKSSLNEQKATVVELFRQVVLVERDAHLYQTVIDRFDELLMNDPLFGEGWTKLGITAAAIGQIDKAQHAFEVAKTLGSEDPELYHQFGRVLGTKRDHQGVHRELQHALKLVAQANSSPALIMRIRSDLCFNFLPLQDWRGAIDCSSAESENVTEGGFFQADAPANLFVNRAMAFLNLEDEENAIEALTLALKVSEDLLRSGHENYSLRAHADTHNNIATIMFNRNDLNGAKRHFDSAIKLSPNHKGAKDNYKLLLDEIKDIPSA